MTIEKSSVANQEYQLRKICQDKGITDAVAIRAEMAKLGIDFYHGGGTDIDKSAAVYTGSNIDEYLGYMADQGAIIVNRR